MLVILLSLDTPTWISTHGVSLRDRFLNLAHGRTGSPNTSWFDAASAGAESGEHAGYRETREAEEEECARSLSFLASLMFVYCAVGDAVSFEVVLKHGQPHLTNVMCSLPISTHVVAAAMHTKLGGRRNGAAEPEKSVQQVQYQWE